MTHEREGNIMRRKRSIGAGKKVVSMWEKVTPNLSESVQKGKNFEKGTGGRGKNSDNC